MKAAFVAIALVSTGMRCGVSGQSERPNVLIVTRSCHSGMERFNDLDIKFEKLKAASKLFTTDVIFSTYAKISTLEGAQLQKNEIASEVESLMLANVAKSVLSCARLSTLLPQRENIDDVIEISIESEFAGEISFPNPSSPCYISGNNEVHKCEIMHSKVQMSFLNPYDEFQLQYEVLQSIKRSVEDDAYIVPADTRILHVGFLGPDPGVVKMEAASLKEKDVGVNREVTLALFSCFGLILCIAISVFIRRDRFFGLKDYDDDDSIEGSGPSSCIKEVKLMREWSYDRPGGGIPGASRAERPYKDEKMSGSSNHVTFRYPSRDEEDEIVFCVDRSGGEELVGHIARGEEEIIDSPLFRSESEEDDPDLREIMNFKDASS